MYQAANKPSLLGLLLRAK